MTRSLGLAALLLLMATPARGQTSRLGTIEFPTSGPPTAQQHFIRGVLFLHSFEYDAAAVEFREAQRITPAFAMAYWGEAMTYNHPVWNEQDQAAALASLGRLASTASERLSRASTPREQAWLGAVEALYGPGTKPQRDTLYQRAMQRIAEQWPDDVEAQTFYALSLMGLSRTTRVIPTYMRAGAIALAAFAKNPDHPGAAHYVIHAFDDPIHAPLGLPAARAYSRIAPGAAHAQHMTTHIFLALGMWDEVVSQNVIASGSDTTTWKPGHYTIWLGYGLLQQGRFTDALNHLRLVRRNLGPADPAGRRGGLLLMQADYLVNTERWTDSIGLAVVDTQGIGPVPRVVNAFARGLAALKQGNRPAAQAELSVVQSFGNAASPDTRPNQVAIVLGKELSGLLQIATNDTAGGLHSLGEATAIEDTLPMEFGPPLIVKPSHELLGETYLQMGKAREARQQFEQALALAPRRLRSLLGLSRAALQEKNKDVAVNALNQLTRALERGDQTLAEKKEALLMRTRLEAVQGLQP